MCIETKFSLCYGCAKYIYLRAKLARIPSHYDTHSNLQIFINDDDDVRRLPRTKHKQMTLKVAKTKRFIAGFQTQQQKFGP